MCSYNRIKGIYASENNQVIIFAGLSSSSVTEGLEPHFPCLKFFFITGITNPSGKLSETWTCSFEDCISTAYFPGDCKTVQYRKSIFTGYRYFDTVS